MWPCATLYCTAVVRKEISMKRVMTVTIDLLPNGRVQGKAVFDLIDKNEKVLRKEFDSITEALIATGKMLNYGGREVGPVMDLMIQLDILEQEPNEQLDPLEAVDNIINNLRKESKGR